MIKKLHSRPHSSYPAPNKWFVPTALQGKLIMWAHTTVATGHPGTQKTYHLLQEKH